MSHHFFISYTHKNNALAERIVGILEKKGYSAFLYQSIEAGLSYAQAITNAIKSCDYFLLLLTDDCHESEHVLNELDYAISRKKTIIPIQLCQALPSADYQYYLSRTPILFADPEAPESLSLVIDKIDAIYGGKLKRPSLYEKLSEYQKIHDHNREVLTLCELIRLVTAEFKSDPKHQGELVRELYRLYESLLLFSGGYDEETRKVAREVMDTLFATREIFSEPMFTQYIFYTALVLQLIYLEYEIATECVDIRTGGDVHNPFSDETRIERQKPYLEIYEQYCTRDGELKRERKDIPDEERAILKKTPSRIFAYQLITQSTKTADRRRPDTAQEPPLSDDDEILHSIADFMQKGNELFNLLHEKGVAGDFLKCLLTSYERLKNYCMIVGANKVAADCVEKIAEIRQELAAEPESEAVNAKAENGIKSLLGFTTQASGEYDVFISFKSEDADLAKTVYQFCKKNMIETFWSKVSLPELSKADYSTAIDTALDNAKHFVVVLSDLRYLDSHWVNYEMSAFSDEILEGRKEFANFVFIVTDAVYQKLIESNKKELPLRYRRYQILKLSEYEETLLSYLKQL